MFTVIFPMCALKTKRHFKELDEAKKFAGTRKQPCTIRTKSSKVVVCFFVEESQGWITYH